jgi:OmpA-OmpF porin, OOP family
MTASIERRAPAQCLTRAILAASLAVIGGAAFAQTSYSGTASGSPGYVTDSGGRAVTNPFGICWKTGSWSPALAKEPCDAVPRAAAFVPPVAAAPQPAPVAPPPPEPIAIVEPPRPVIEKVTLETDVLFEFGKADLRDAGKNKLDELADRIKAQGANVDEVVAVGHADRIASDDFNQKLSERRAEAVKTYLAGKGIESDKVTAEGRGESQPVTGDDCRRMGPENAKNRKLVACLQPDRRVEIEVLGTRTASTEPAPAGAGTTGSAGTSGSGTSAPGGTAR